ncbi:YIP1 family protein [bacterium]|nr:YIP1 family protein [bacterium]MBU1072880.1 YIP1 family protein [bacterium]MBU1675112.1 YIP1 family protein [bacterium]
MNQLFDRMLRAAKLDSMLYEEVEHDTAATNQAVAVVLLSSAAAGIGSPVGGGLGAMFTGAVIALISWFVWFGIVYAIGTKLLPEPQTEADYGQLLRTIGFSSAPGVIRVIGFIPLLYWLVTLIASVWMLVAMVIAVRQALDYRGTGRAIIVCLIGWAIMMILSTVAFSLFGHR